MGDGEKQVLFSWPWARRQHRPSYVKVGSTIQRLGSTMKPSARSDRLAISVRQDLNAWTATAIVDL
jgi:hypothetical protein